MKKKILSGVLLAALSTCSIAADNEKLLVGLKMVPLSVSGFKSGYLNDSVSYNDASTGYGQVNYGDANTEGAVGLSLGYQKKLSEELYTTADITYASDYIELNVGADYAITGLMDKLTIKVGPKIGYATLTKDAGTVESSLNIVMECPL